MGAAGVGRSHTPHDAVVANPLLPESWLWFARNRPDRIDLAESYTASTPSLWPRLDLGSCNGGGERAPVGPGGCLPWGAPPHCKTLPGDRTPSLVLDQGETINAPSA